MSLVTTPASRIGACSSCRSTRITRISMKLTDGSLVDFTSCHTCERKSWHEDGRELEVATVLAKAKKHKAA